MRCVVIAILLINLLSEANGQKVSEKSTEMTLKAVEIRCYNLKPGTRDEFHKRALSVVPMLRQYNIDVVDLGPSAHDDNSFYLVRAFNDLEDRRIKEDAFYTSEDWKKGPRESILELIESFTTVVISADDLTKVLAYLKKGDKN